MTGFPEPGTLTGEAKECGVGERAAPSPDSLRAADILAMHRLAHKADGVQALLRWLARRTGCWVGLVDPAGGVEAASSHGSGPDVMALVADGLRVMRERGLRTFVAGESPGRSGALLAVGVPGDPSGPEPSELVLAVVGPDPLGTAAPVDAVPLLGVCWRARETERTRRRVEIADARGREAVLHLLMSGNLTTAHQIAGALAPRLSDPARFHVVECGAGRRAEAIRVCAELTAGQAWIVRCPVYSDHVLMVAPASLGAVGARPLEAALAAEIEGCVVGTGDALALRDTAAGYEQAFHALAVARGRPERWARFDAALGLPVVAGRHGHAWADRLLAPLTGHVPARATAPDSRALTDTVRSWLSFSSAATRHMKIHRNTLASRLRRVESLLGLDLELVGDQARLDLALRIGALPRVADHRPAGTAGPGGTAEPVGTADAAEPASTADAAGTAGVAGPTGPAPVEDVFEALLRLPAVREWALTQLRPVREEAPALEATLRTWLRNDTRLSATAQALGVSVTGTRKRLMRLEQVMRRSLVRVPNARHDLWLAVEVLDRGRPDRNF
ncbi:helix-turn-helix domain-containing protein [Streptomyces sp. NPDC056909]|uniref:helix-turn-helix domain-containing protein n=1 Tax=Streptomyces sp. NPDC056909 TaxID=3345963 RepID=UPI0036A1FA3D